MEFQEAVGAAIANEDKIIYKDSTYELVSKVAYLIGVPRHIFENEHEAPQMEVFERLEADKAARIIRHLSIIRTAIERNFRHINSAMRIDYRTILSMPEHVPADSLHLLKIDSILSVELATFQEKEAKDIDNIAAVRLAKHLVPLAVKTDAVAEAFSWASFINQTGISKALLNNNLTKLGEKLCSEHRALDFHYAVFDNAYKDRLLAEL